MKNKNDELEKEEEFLPFSSLYVADYIDEIEYRFEQQSNKKGRPSKEWKEAMNKLIENCEDLRRTYLPATDKKRIYDRIK